MEKEGVCYNKAMPTKQSPSGANFPYYYKNGELFGMHLESYGADSVGVVAMLKAETAFILRQNFRMGAWINFYGTTISDAVIEGLAEMATRIHPSATRLALVGCGWLSRWKIRRRLAKAQGLDGLPVRFFSDPEEAKTWLVSEGE